MPITRKEQSNATRKRIMQTALRLFAVNGYERTTTRKIAEDAKMSVSLLYNYFDSKDELLKAIFLEGFGVIKAMFKKDRYRDLTLEVFLQNTFRLIRRHPDFWRLFYSLRMSAVVQELLEEEVDEMVVFVHYHFQSLLKTTKVEATSTEAHILFATVDGLINHYIFQGEQYPIVKVIRRLVEKYG
ncbi:MAG: TetR/AcrR family transcriptional regulator [Chitinophagales bacterium]